MALTTRTIQPWVVELGSGTISENAWLSSNDSVGGVWSAGEYLQKTSTGQVEIADAGGGEGIHMVALEDHAAADGEIFVPVLEIAEDTVFAGQLTSATAPAQTDIGDMRNLEVNSNIWSVTTSGATDSSDQVEIVNIWKNVFWYNTSHDFAGAQGILFFKINPAILNLAPAAITAS